MDPAEYQSAGLYDPAAPDAAERLALLEYLAERGMTITDMLDADARRALHAAASDARIRPGRRMTAQEVADEVGIPVDLLEKITVSAGVVVAEDDYRESDVETFKLFAGGQEIFGADQLLQFTRVVGSAMARVAEAALLLFLVNVEDPLQREGADATALAVATEMGVDALHVVPQVMDGLFRLHVEAAIARQRQAGRASHQGPDAFELAVGFVDLVGFTPLTQDLSTGELANFVEDFEVRANEVVATHGGRVVKHIGDEVMFVVVDAAAGCEIALRLVEAFGGEAGVEPHAGLGFGTVVARGGDYYGSVVNLATRIAAQAVPGEVLVTTEAYAAAHDAPGLTFAPAGRRMLKGFAAPVPLYSVAQLRP
jgi:class 3 adenylate cyclase